MTWTEREKLIFTIKFGMGKGIERVRGWPRALSGDDHTRIAEAIVQHLELSNYTITPGQAAQNGPSPKWAR
jgi:hypothetical protein